MQKTENSNFACLYRTVSIIKKSGFFQPTIDPRALFCMQNMTVTIQNNAYSKFIVIFL